MKNLKALFIILFEALLLVAGNVSVWAQAVQQTGDQSQSDSSTAAKDKKKKTADAPTATAPAPAAVASAPTATKPTNAAPSAAPVSKPTAPAAASKPANNSGMVWVNTVSGVYHKPGMHWYGKTKKGKYMTEADAQKTGYRPAKE